MKAISTASPPFHSFSFPFHSLIVLFRTALPTCRPSPVFSSLHSPLLPYSSLSFLQTVPLDKYTISLLPGSISREAGPPSTPDLAVGDVPRGPWHLTDTHTHPYGHCTASSRRWHIDYVSFSTLSRLDRCSVGENSFTRNVNSNEVAAYMRWLIIVHFTSVHSGYRSV